MSRRYKTKVLNLLGFTHTFCDLPKPVSIPVLPADDMSQIASFGFENVIKVIFESQQGDIPNLLDVMITDNTPDSVKQFVNHVLSTDIKSITSAPDSSTAFDLIWPKQFQDSSNLSVYTDSIRSYIDKYSKEFSSSKSSDTTD